MIPEKDAKKYSFLRLIRHLADGSDAGLEREISRECEKKLGTPAHGGVFVPSSLPVEVRTGLVTTSNSAGGYSVQTTIQPLIDLLRNAMVVRQAGATVLSGLSDTLAFPKQLTAGTAAWVAENPGSDNADADLTLGQVAMSPKMLTTNSSYSRKLLAQTSGEVDQWVRDDLIAVIALAMDLAALNGSGASNQPVGILNTANVNLIPFGTDGAAPSYADFVSMETQINVANLPANGPRAYVVTPEVKGFGRRTVKVSGQVLGTIVDPDGTINGYPCFTTNQLPKTLTRGAKSDCHAGVFGDFSSLMIGEWGAIELISDPFRLKKQGVIEICAYMMTDIAVRYPVAFTASKFWSASTL